MKTKYKKIKKAITNNKRIKLNIIKDEQLAFKSLVVKSTKLPSKLTTIQPIKTVTQKPIDLVIEDKPAKEKYELVEILNKIILGDCLKIMEKMPAECVDMVFVDPPYFLQLPAGRKLLRWSGTEVNGVNEQWDVFKDFEDYDNFTKNYLTIIKRLMKPNATIWVIGMYHNIHRVGKIMQDLGFWILNDVIWFKTNPMPNWLGVRFTNATEILQI